jgi:uncharacterized protein
LLGRLVLPFQRPIEECRTFRSEQVERLINEVTSKLVDKDLARLFENCFPNTLDTTVRWHQADPKDPQSFIITGDMYFPLDYLAYNLEMLNGFPSRFPVTLIL